MSFRDTNMLADTCPRCQKRLGFVFGLRGLGWRQRGHEGKSLRRSLRNGETQETLQTTAAPLAQEAIGAVQEKHSEATAQIADHRSPPSPHRTSTTPPPHLTLTSLSPPAHPTSLPTPRTARIPLSCVSWLKPFLV